MGKRVLVAGGRAEPAVTPPGQPGTAEQGELQLSDLWGHPWKRKNSLDQWKHGDESSWGFCTGKRLALAWQLHVAPMATEEQGWELSSPPMGPSLLRGTGRVLLGLLQGPGEGFTSAFSECCHGLVVVEVSVVPYWKFIRGW